MFVEIAVSAAILCSNTNYLHSERCMAPVESMEVYEWGFDGYLESGVYWRQIKVNDDLQYFQMEDVKYFIHSKGIVYRD